MSYGTEPMETGKKPGAGRIIGVSTIAAIVAGLAVWLIVEFAMGEPRSEAISYGAWAGGAIIVLGVIYAVILALGSPRGC